MYLNVCIMDSCEFYFSCVNAINQKNILENFVFYDLLEVECVESELCPRRENNLFHNKILIIKRFFSLVFL